MARVYGIGTEGAPGDRIFAPIEDLIYRTGQPDPNREQRWNVYAKSVLAFSLVSVLFFYLLQRMQATLRSIPMAWGGSATAGVQHRGQLLTNTNWQNYGGESTMAHFTQMAGLAVQNFVSAAVGMAVAVAVVRGLGRRRSNTIGNSWVDLTR